jgi:spoIIIJ-associated protein
VTQGQTPPGDMATNVQISEPTSEPLMSEPVSTRTSPPPSVPTNGPTPGLDTGQAAATEEAAEHGSEGTRTGPRAENLEQEGEIAADYLEGLLDIADLDGDIDMDVEGGRAAVSIVGGQLTRLVGRDGEVLEALQELTRLAVLRATGERSRLMLDVAGYRAARRRQLTGVGQQAAADAKSSGEPVKLRPMTPFERKIVHDAVAGAGLRSESEGEEPGRCVVVFPA